MQEAKLGAAASASEENAITWKSAQSREVMCVISDTCHSQANQQTETAREIVEI